MPFLEYQITPTVARIDAIWDNYPEGNLKSLTHQRRGTGLRNRIGDGHTQIPKHEWNSGFLKNEENKKEFSFLGEDIVKKDLGGKLLISTNCDRVLSNRPCDVSALEPCNHSEADTMTPDSLYVRTVDSDIVNLVIRFFTTLGLLELLGWLREWEKLHDIPIHYICSDLGPSRSMALPLFHATSGCDTISHVPGCGKNTAWASWQNTPGLTETLLPLTNTPSCFRIGSLHMQKLERFVVITYSKGCGLAKVNEARSSFYKR